jgi:hypothetical protein
MAKLYLEDLKGFLEILLIVGLKSGRLGFKLSLKRENFS